MLRHLICIVILLFLYKIIPTTSRSSKITFSKDTDFDSNCKLNDNSDGTCKTLINCPQALEEDGKLKSCYFQGNEQFICCRNDKLQESTERKCVKACFGTRTIVREIIQGLSTLPDEFPYMMALGWPTNGYEESSYDFKCGGVMIENDFILTAAHCIDRFGAKPTVVLMGGRPLSSIKKGLRFVNPIKKIFVHPEYHSNSTYHDIAIIRVKNGMFHCSPTCLWTMPVFQDDNNVTAIGYGNTVLAGLPSDTLLRADLSIVPNEQCKDFYKPDRETPQGLIKTQMCAKDIDGIRDTCQGDSGGPIILEMEINHRTVTYVVGITSFGRGCALNAPGVYTRVSEYLDWIESIVWEKK